MIAATYGLQVRQVDSARVVPPLIIVSQAIIFILKREFMLVGWMVVYIISYVTISPTLPSACVITSTVQVSGLQLLPSRLLVLVHGRIRMG